MHYFKRNIGDYHKKAGRLSMLEHGAYTLLLDSYYDRERPPTKQEALEWTWARTPEEISAVEFVLSRYFELDGGVYRQSRIDEEIDKYHSNALTNKRIAEEREKKRREKKARSVNEPCTDEHEAPPNHKPITNNHKPEKEKKGTKRFVPPSVQDVRDYCQTRNNKVDPERFIDHYTSNGWKVGKNSMKDWKASVRTWEKRDNEESSGVRSHKPNAAERYHDSLKQIANESCSEGVLQDGGEVWPQMAVCLPNAGDD